MNSDFPPPDPRAELEASLTALLVGELPHEAAAALHQKLAQDPELAQLYERLKHTINLVRETITTPAEQTAAQPAPLKLSDPRRQKLLQHFKTVRPKEFVRPRRREMRWLIPVAAVVAFVALLGALLIPALSRGKSRSLAMWGFASDEATAGSARPAASQGGYKTLGPDSSETAQQASREERARASYSAKGVDSAKVNTHEAQAFRLSKGGAPAKGVPQVGAAGSSIVLPKTTELAFAPMSAVEGGKPWSDSGTRRAFYADIADGSGAGGGGASGQSGGSTRGGIAVTEGRQTEVASVNDFFAQADRSTTLGAVTTPGAGSAVEGWSDNMHSKQGNIALADGSVQGVSLSRLRAQLQNSGSPNDALLFPDAPPATPEQTPQQSESASRNRFIGSSADLVQPPAPATVPPPVATPVPSEGTQAKSDNMSLAFSVTPGLTAGTPPAESKPASAFNKFQLNSGAIANRSLNLNRNLEAPAAAPAPSPTAVAESHGTHTAGIVLGTPAAAPGQTPGTAQADETLVHTGSGRSQIRGAADGRKGAEMLTESAAAQPKQPSPTGSYYGDGGDTYGAYSTYSQSRAGETPAGTVHIKGVGDVPVTELPSRPTPEVATRSLVRVPAPAQEGIAVNGVVPSRTEQLHAGYALSQPQSSLQGGAAPSVSGRASSPAKQADQSAFQAGDWSLNPRPAVLDAPAAGGRLSVAADDKAVQERLGEVPPVSELAAAGKPLSPTGVSRYGMEPRQAGVAGESAGKSSPTAEFGFGGATANGDNLKYAWDYAARAQPAPVDSGGNKLPILGDTPALGRFYRVAPAVGEGLPANTGTPATGLARGEPAAAAGDVTWGSFDISLAKPNITEGDGRQSHFGRPAAPDGKEVAADAWRLLPEGQVKSMDLVDYDGDRQKAAPKGQTAQAGHVRASEVQTILPDFQFSQSIGGFPGAPAVVTGPVSKPATGGVLHAEPQLADTKGKDDKSKIGDLAESQSHMQERFATFDLHNANLQDAQTAVQDLFKRSSGEQGTHSADKAGRNTTSTIVLPATPDGVIANEDVSRDVELRRGVTVTGITGTPSVTRKLEFRRNPASQIAEGRRGVEQNQGQISGSLLNAHVPAALLSPETAGIQVTTEKGITQNAQPGNDPTKASALVHDGMLLYQLGKLDEARAKLNEAKKLDPHNRPAYYYENLVSEAQFRGALHQRDVASRSRLQDVEGRQTDTPVYTGRGRADILKTSPSKPTASPPGAPESVANADVPAMLLSAESLRRTEGRRIETKAEVARQETMLERLKTLTKEEQAKALPTAVSDGLLSSLLEQQTMAEQKLALAKKDAAPDKDEVARLQATLGDLNKKAEERAASVVMNLEAKVQSSKQNLAALEQEVARATKQDAEKATKSRPYFEAKHKLEELQRFGQVLSMKIASENTDLTLPKSTMVEIVEKAAAQPAERPNLLARVFGKAGGESESTARIKVERDQADIPSLQGPRAVAGYDPYFIQTEFEAMQSEAVLGKVIKDLKLNEAWAKKQGGRALTIAETMALLKNKLTLRPVGGTSLVDVAVKSGQPEEAANIANAVAQAYKTYRNEQREALTKGGIAALKQRRAEVEQKIAAAQREVEQLQGATTNQQADVTPAKPPASAPIPQPEVQSAENAYSTFSLNVSDVSLKLAAASLEKGVMPDPANVRSEEFINAFDYRDPEPSPGVPVAFAWERAQYPFAQNRDLLRFSIKTAALGRQPGRPLNLVLLLDNSGSMERADRVQIIREALRVLAGQLQPQDLLSVVTFSRTAQLRVDGVFGSQAAQVVEEVSGLTPEGGTNLEDAMNLAYQTALRHYLANGVNRVVLLTDGAANLGDVEPEALKQKVETNRKQGIALDCFGIGWEGYNDDLLEVLSRNGDGRYGFINTPEEAATEFAGQLAGALHVAASDVKVQVEFNPARVTAYRQMGYAKHQLTKEQFRDNTVDAAEIGAAEAGNALYAVEVNPGGSGPLCTVRVRYKVPGTSDYHEHEWPVPYTGTAVALEQASPAMRLAASANAFAEWLVTSPYAAEVNPDRLLGLLNGVPEIYGADGRPKKLEWMVRQAKSIAGK